MLSCLNDLACLVACHLFDWHCCYCCNQEISLSQHPYTTLPYDLFLNLLVQICACTFSGQYTGLSEPDTEAASPGQGLLRVMSSPQFDRPLIGFLALLTEARMGMRAALRGGVPLSQCCPNSNLGHDEQIQPSIDYRDCLRMCSGPDGYSCGSC